MFARVQQVTVKDASHLILEFDNGEKKVFDVSPYTDKGIFKELKEFEYFSKVRVSGGTVVWPNEQDFCPDTLYLKSESIH